MSWEQAPSSRRRTPAVWLVALALLVGATTTVGVGWFRARGGDALTVTGDDLDAGTTATDRTDGRRSGDLDGRVVARTDGDGPLLPDRPAMTIIAADFAGRLHMIDAATGEQRTVRVFPRRSPDELRIVGGNVVLDIARRVVMLSPDEVTEPRQLATSHRSVVTADPSSLWVYDAATRQVGGTALRVDLEDSSVLDRIDLPPLAQPLAGTNDGLVVATPGSISRVGTDGSRRLVARGEGLVSDGTNLARLDCRGDLSCGIALGTIDDPDRRVVTLRDGDVPAGLVEAPGGAFSPDGRFLALTLVRERPFGGMDQPMVAVIDVAFGTEIGRMRGSPLTLPRTPVGWSRDGAWLAVSTGSRLQLWSTEQRRAHDLDVSLSPTYAIAVW